MFKKFIAITLMFSLLLTGCATNKTSDMKQEVSSTSGVSWYSSGLRIQADSMVSSNSASKSESQIGTIPAMKNPEAIEDVEQNFVERKIVYSVYTSLQTKDLDVALETLNENISKYNGYIQSQKQYNNGSIYDKYQRRSTSMIIRVPSQHLESFLNGLENENMYTLSINKESRDYSESYYDKESRINNLRIQEERLLELLKNAQDLESILELERRLSDIRYEIESLTKELRVIDSNVDYSTITLDLEEVIKYDETLEEPETFFERIKEATTESWGNFIEWTQDSIIGVIYLIPTLVVLAIIVPCVIFFVRKLLKKKQQKNQEKSE